MRFESLAACIFLTALFSTFFCTAVNCYTWRLAYPLWLKVGAGEFAGLHREYLAKLTPVITLPHVLMFFSSGALLRWRPGLLSFATAGWIFLLNAAVVLVSVFAAGPIHDRFVREGGLERFGLARLVRISALRSVLMLASSALFCQALWPLLLS